MFGKCFGLTSSVKEHSVDNAKTAIHQTTGVERSMLHSQRQFSKPVQAQFGAEIEIGSIRLTNRLPRGTILHQGNGWRLETDNLTSADGTIHSDLEFIIEPQHDFAEIETIVKEIVQFSGRLMDAADGASSKKIQLSDVLPNSKHVELVCTDTVMKANVQTTFGISLTDFKNLIENVSHIHNRFNNTHETRILNDWVNHLCAHLVEHLQVDISDNLYGFLYVMCSQLLRCRNVEPGNNHTIHTVFQVMLRSDSCSIFHKLLNSNEQEIVKFLILENQEKKVPFLECINMDQSTMVFKKPYIDSTGKNQHNGPTVRDWLKSIVYGRDEQNTILFKDLLSPPPGYPQHDPSNPKCYGMGAMGVDEKNQLLLVELRGAKTRDDNHCLSAASQAMMHDEFSMAEQLNPHLSSDSAQGSYNNQHKILVDKLVKFFILIKNANMRLSSILSELNQPQSNSSAKILEFITEFNKFSYTFNQMNAIDAKQKRGLFSNHSTAIIHHPSFSSEGKALKEICTSINETSNLITNTLMQKTESKHLDSTLHEVLPELGQHLANIDQNLRTIQNFVYMNNQ